MLHNVLHTIASHAIIAMSNPKIRKVFQSANVPEYTGKYPEISLHTGGSSLYLMYITFLIWGSTLHSRLIAGDNRLSTREHKA